MKKVIIFLLLACGSAFGQTWIKVATGSDVVAAPAGTILRYGANASIYSCDSGTHKAGDPSAAAWSPSLTLTADTTITDDSIFGVDPAYCVVKEIDILETTAAQTVTVNGTIVNVPGLPDSPSVNMPGSVIKTEWSGPMIPCWRQNVTAKNPDGSDGKTYTAEICGPIN